MMVGQRDTHVVIMVFPVLIMAAHRVALFVCILTVGDGVPIPVATGSRVVVWAVAARGTNCAGTAINVAGLVVFASRSVRV